MNVRYFAAACAAIAVFASSSTAAEPVRSCPAGEAVNSLRPNGTPVTCLPIPAPVDLGPVNAAIAAEAQARAAGDAELRALLTENGIGGRYAFTGSQACMSSSSGFNDDLTPRSPTPGGNPVIVQNLNYSVSGIATFNADRSGTLEIRHYAVAAPSLFYTTTSAGVAFSGGPPRPSGNGSTSVQTGSFDWDVAGGQLFIQEGVIAGPILKGGARAGWTVMNRDVPRLVGALGRDLRVITVTHDDVAPETAAFVSPDGLQTVESTRVCVRERTLRKLPD